MRETSPSTHSSLQDSSTRDSSGTSDVLSTLNAHHPRLLAAASRREELRNQAQSDDLLRRFLQRLENQAHYLDEIAPVVYQKEGRRLLAVSRTVLQRVLLLGFQYQLSGEEKFAQRAEQEMLAAAAFDDWNPSHFLDAAEMTAALAIGYDWLFQWLSEKSRGLIRKAMVEKGLQPGLVPQFFHKGENNWNQVCWCGMVLGALAIAEDEPQLATQYLQLVKEDNHYGLRPYQPDGVYPEGPMYWSYGTSFQVVLIEALRSALGKDWDLSQSAGFMESAAAFVQTTAPSGDWFNFSDCSLRSGIEPALFWFARALQQRDLLQFEWIKLVKFTSPDSLSEAENNTKISIDGGRLLPLAALWWPQEYSGQQEPLPLCWHGEGANPLAVFRSAWHDPNAMYLAVKGGSASLNHGHMDAGSFVFEAAGVRWAEDLGMQSYHSLESKGVNLWDAAQEGERWNIFRLGNFSHNTLTINGQRHCVNGHASIMHFSDEETKEAVIDLTAIFAGQAQKVRRSFIFQPGHFVSIEDEIAGLNAGDEVRWAMVTSAEIEIDEREAVLRRDGRVLRVRLLEPLNARWEFISADSPDDGFNAANPGKRILLAKVLASQSGVLKFIVSLESERIHDMRATA